MLDLGNRPVLGRYALMRQMQSHRLADRWLAVHEQSHTTHVVYRFAAPRDHVEKRRFVQSVEHVARLDHTHILAVEQFSFDYAGRPCVVSPFTGDVDGLLTLGRLLRAKGGQMSPDEAGRAMTQLLEAVANAHEQGIGHGAVLIDEILVDRRGSVSIELYGLERALHDTDPLNEARIADEVRSVVEIGYQLMTGLRAEPPVIPAGRLIKKLDARWDAWLSEGLDPLSGFDSAHAALEALPGRVEGADQSLVVVPPTTKVRTVLGRIRGFRTVGTD